MNHTASAVVGFTVVAAATVGVWFAQRWRTGKSGEAELAARIALGNALHKGPDDGSNPTISMSIFVYVIIFKY